MILLIKKTFGYKERNEEKRAEFLEKIKEIPKEHLVYIDESGIRKNESIEYGWSKKGERLYDLRNGVKHKALNLIGALQNKKLTAPFAFEGTCDTKVFDAYLFSVLKPTLNKKSVIVLDNATFHRSSKIKKLCKDIGCSYLFLPPYSPDFNEIEGYWHSIKSRLRKLMRDKSDSLMTLITEVFMGLNKSA